MYGWKNGKISQLDKKSHGTFNIILQRKEKLLQDSAYMSRENCFACKTHADIHLTAEHVSTPKCHQLERNWRVEHCICLPATSFPAFNSLELNFLGLWWTNQTLTMDPRAGKASGKLGDGTILPDNWLLPRGQILPDQEVARATAHQFWVISMKIEFTF